MDDSLNGLCGRWHLPTPSTSTHANDFAAKCPRLIRVLSVCKSSLKTQPPAGFSALLRRIFDLFGHAPDD